MSNKSTTWRELQLCAYFPNKFARAVAVGNPHEYTQTEKEEQEIAEGCNWLIKNSIICWNYLYADEPDNLHKLKKGAISVPIPAGFPARVINPDGSYSTPFTVRLVPSGDGVKTAYPEP